MSDSTQTTGRGTSLSIIGKHRVLLAVAGVICVAMLLFPPWIEKRDQRDYRTVTQREYSFIGDPPLPDSARGSIFIDFERLALQMLGLSIAVGVVMLIRQKNRRTA